MVWDSSAVLALIFEEEATPIAFRAWESDSRPIAWRWMMIETHAALARRNGTPSHWADWQWRMDRFEWSELSSKALEQLMQANISWKLRSADAGHVYLFRQFQEVAQNIRLVTFDREMEELCKANGWPLWRG